ncbi:MAG: translation initiation factor IF-2 N-terminal domain-containing protein, partial [Desulfovibrio sp.]|nr:translation initiation factor IF-2 N-terminal domain-containing protein [Desulfovibrio sp.]
MSDKKIKIKELACELKVSNPDMLKAAMDEGISARNSAASVTPEEADRLRKHFDKLRGDDKSKEVIVRRRTGPRPPRGERGRAQAKSGEAPEAKPAELAADQAQSQPAGQEAPAAPVKAPVQEQAPQAEAKPQAEPQAQAPASEAPKEASALEAREGQAAEASDDRPHEQAGGEAEAPRVRIISRPAAP